MGIQINGQTDTISATDGGFTIDGASGNLIGNLTGNVTGNLTGTASTATAAATAYGLSGSPTLSGITSVSTTNLTVNGNAYPTAGPLSNRNLIINGDMSIAQRGTSSTTNGYATVDRWINSYVSGTVTQSQETLTSGDPYDEGFRNFFRVTNTSASASPTTESQTFLQYIEGYNIASSGWNYKSSSSYVTLSFWVRSSLAGTYYGKLGTFDGTSYVYPFSITLSANTWTKVTKTIPGNSNLTLDNDNGPAAAVYITSYYGTNNTDPGVSLETWSAFNATAQYPDFPQNWKGTASATFDITGVQLEVGEVATPFEHRSYGDELARCLRYYEKSYNYSTVPGTPNTGTGAHDFQGCSDGGPHNILCTIRFAVEKRDTPGTVQTWAYDGTSGQWEYSRSGAAGQTTVTVAPSSQKHLRLYLAVGAAWVPARMVGHWAVSSEL